MSTTRITRHFAAPPERIYRAILSAAEVERWLVPEGMTGEIHDFEARPGGTFRISLTYETGGGAGKTTAVTDSYHGRFIELVQDRRVVQSMAFESTDPAMQGEMTLTYILTPAGGGTELTALHEHVPRGVAPTDNETGWRMSLDKLAKLVER